MCDFVVPARKHCGEGEESGEDREDVVPLEPLDLVWAKCRGYPWYPALVSDNRILLWGLVIIVNLYRNGE